MVLVLTCYKSSLLPIIVLYFVVFIALFCRWLQEKPLPYERYSHYFEKAPIIQERFVNLADLKDSFIPNCFEGRGCEKLPSDLRGVCKPLIREFYANATLKEDYIECWVRGRAFTLDMGDIDGILRHGELDHEDFIPFKDRMVSLESVQLRLGGVREGNCLNTISFPPNLRCLAYIMMFNLYPIRKLTTINNVRAIFLMELREKIYIDMGAHLYTIIAKATRTISRAKLFLPSLIMRIFHENVVETPQDISLMSVPPSINSQTILRSRVRLSKDEQAEEPEQAPPADIEIEVEGQQPPPRRGGG